jgi:hypothetical protein
MDDHVGTSWLSMYAASAEELLTCTAADKDTRARAAARGALRQLAFGHPAGNGTARSRQYHLQAARIA